jgi:hypothetical protein
MRRTFPLAALALLAAAPIATPAPVPKAKPPVECILTLNGKKNPLEDKAFAIELKNNTDKAIDLLSTLPGGVFVFLDVEIQNADGKRISPEFYDARIASPYAPPPRRIGVLEPNKAQRLELHPLSRYFEKPDEIKPGKYRVRVTFGYDKHGDDSEWVNFEVK